MRRARSSLADAEAERITKTGAATVATIEKQAAASASARNRLTGQVVERIAEALEKSGVDIVPRVEIDTRTAKAPVDQCCRRRWDSSCPREARCRWQALLPMTRQKVGQAPPSSVAE